MLSLRSTALARPQLYPLDWIADQPVMGRAASPWLEIWQRHHGCLSGSAAQGVSYVTLLWLGDAEPAAGGGDHGAGPARE